MHSADVLVQEGIRLAAMGGHAEAVALFTRAVEMEPGNETAWLWLAELAEDYNRQIKCFEEVLGINPKNHVAQERLASLKASPPATEPPQADDSSGPVQEQETVSLGEPIQQPPATAQCWRCGAQNPATNTFCGRCGAGLAERSQEAVRAQAVESVRSEATVEPARDHRVVAERPVELETPTSATAASLGGVEPEPSSKHLETKPGCGWGWLLVGGGGAALLVVVTVVVAWASGLVKLPSEGAKATTPSMPSSATTPASASSIDDQYLDCAQDVMIEWAKLTGDATQGATDLASGAGMESLAAGLSGFCADQDRWEGTAERLRNSHSRCGAPTDANLRAAQQYVENGLGETAAGIAFFGSFCDELMNFGPDWGALSTGDARLQASNQWADRASREMEKYSP